MSDFMARAIALSREGMRAGEGGPFGAVVVRGGEIVGEGFNRVLRTLDPTAHAEMIAIRAASSRLGRFRLDDCEIYSSCEPCPMCLGAIHWARIPRVYYANTAGDAQSIGYDDEKFYREMAQGSLVELVRMDAAEARAVFDEWRDSPQRQSY
jgi:tRNA(Arg) A34 adenosine deaminase TadA